MTNADQPDTSTAASGSSEAELIQVRRDKLAKLREMGIDPFGARFDTDTEPGTLRADF